MVSESEKTNTKSTVEQSSGTNAKVIVAVIIAVAALAFVFSNVAPATLRFLFLQFTMPAWGWFLAVLAAGVVVGSLFPWFRPKKKK